MKRVLIPPYPGLFSAFGLLIANVEHQFVRACFRRAGELSGHELDHAYAALERQARSTLAQEGCEPSGAGVKRYADLRYSGQAYELTVAVPGGPLTAAHVSEIVEAFEAEHFRTYGHRAEDEPVDFVSVRVIAEAAPDRYSLSTRSASDSWHGHSQPPSVRERQAYFGSEHGLRSVPVLARRDLGARRVSGPVIVEEYDATCVVPPDCAATLDERGNIAIDIGVGAA
jgi:N-methylhydantoinase A